MYVGAIIPHSYSMGSLHGVLTNIFCTWPEAYKGSCRLVI